MQWTYVIYPVKTALMLAVEVSYSQMPLFIIILTDRTTVASYVRT